MARGRHQKSKLSRDLHAAEAELATVRAELATEESLMAGAVAARVIVDGLRADLASACEVRDRACGPEAARLIAEIAALEPWRSPVRDGAREIQARWEKASDAYNLLGASFREGTENLLSLISGVDQTLIQPESLAPQPRLSTDVQIAIQRARGERSDPPMHHHSAQQQSMLMELLLSRVPADEVAAVAENREARDDLIRRASSALDVSARSVSAWHPMPWIAEPSIDRTSPDMSLGLTFDSVPTNLVDAAEVPAQPVATMSAAARVGLAAGSPRRVFEAWKRGYAAEVAHAANSHIPLPVSAMPRHPVPADAAALRHWYAAAAWGSSLRCPVEQGFSSAQARLAIATQAAVPFWLPPGHTVNYVDSEPLSSTDLDELRLPFAQVFLAFADPLQIEPQEAGEVAGFEKAQAWMAQTVSRLTGSGGGVRFQEVLSAGTQGFTAQRLSFGDLVSKLGARVEGVVLLADASGRLDDEFGWCVTIPATSGGVLGRWTLPASLQRTRFRDQVVNLAAVTAWGDWHRPDDDPGSSRRHPETRDGGDPGGRGDSSAFVRVLNVKAAARGDSSGGSESGTHVAPHIRRGHWRRQRFGPNRSLIRRVRISPVLVNSSRGDIGHRVYRLPTQG